MATEHDDELAPGERIPPHLRRPPHWHALAPVLLILSAVIALLNPNNESKWPNAALLVAALLLLGRLLVQRRRRAPANAPSRRL